MELEELKTAWKSATQRIDEMQLAQATMQRSLVKSHTRSAANKLMIQPIFELIVASLTVLWAGGFLGSNLAKIQALPFGAVPGIIVFALGMFNVILSIRQLHLISTMDFSEPVVATQRKIATLRSWRVRSTQFLIMVGFGLWMVFPLFILQALGGYEAIKIIGAANTNWLIGNFAIGVILPVAVILAARKFGAQSKFFRAIDNVFAGDQIVAAEKLLAEVDGFDRS